MQLAVVCTVAAASCKSFVPMMSIGAAYGTADADRPESARGARRAAAGTERTRAGERLAVTQPTMPAPLRACGAVRRRAADPDRPHDGADAARGDARAAGAGHPRPDRGDRARARRVRRRSRRPHVPRPVGGLHGAGLHPQARRLARRGWRRGSGFASRPAAWRIPRAVSSAARSISRSPSRFSEPTDFPVGAPLQRPVRSGRLAGEHRGQRPADVGSVPSPPLPESPPLAAAGARPLAAPGARARSRDRCRGRGLRGRRAAAARHAPDHLPAGTPRAGVESVGERRSPHHRCSSRRLSRRWVWHPRADGDPAHRWLRAHMREVANFLN